MSKPWTFAEDKFLAGWFDPKAPDCMEGRTAAACAKRARFLKRLGLWEDLHVACHLDERYSLVIEWDRLEKSEKAA